MIYKIVKKTLGSSLQDFIEIAFEEYHKEIESCDCGYELETIENKLHDMLIGIINVYGEEGFDYIIIPSTETGNPFEVLQIDRIKK
jgi:hypothetical protein